MPAGRSGPVAVDHQQRDIDATTVLAQVLGPGENGCDRGVRGRLPGDLNRLLPDLLGNGEPLLVTVEPAAELIDETGVIGGAGIRQLLESSRGMAPSGLSLVMHRAGQMDPDRIAAPTRSDPRVAR